MKRAEVTYGQLDKVLRVVETHLDMVRVTLENFGIADPTAFAKKLQKAG